MEPFEIWMDYENLKYFQEPHKLDRRQARWYLKLQDYDFTLRHILGKINTKVDILLRRDQVNTKEDNKNIQMLKEELWTRRITAEITILKRTTRMEDSDILKEIRNNNTKEKEVIQTLEKKDSETWEEERIVYKEEKIYIPNNKKLKERILKKIMTRWMWDIQNNREYVI